MKKVTTKTKRTAKKAVPKTSIPRAPQREQGRVRYNLLVDCADRLLEQKATGEISLYDIADAADVPAASVYHFFPSMAAATVAVAQRYLLVFEGIVASPLIHADLCEWRDIFRIKSALACDFYNSHPVARKLLLGSEYSWHVRMTDVQSNATYSHILARTYHRHFFAPEPSYLDGKIEIAIGLNDAVWSLSCLHHGNITDDFAIEGERAYHAYLSNYLAELTPMRSTPFE